MHVNEVLAYTFEQVQQLTERTVRDLDAEALAWRPDAEANSIGWLVWHLTRVEDSHVAEVAGDDQIWGPEWAERFGLATDYDDTGYGHSAEQVGHIRPEGPAALRDYHAEVAAMTTEFLRGQDDDAFDRIIDETYDPPVTVGVRMVSVIGDAMQHLGQAAYVRGLHERRS